jgi:hypothetical protein
MYRDGSKMKRCFLFLFSLFLLVGRIDIFAQKMTVKDNDSNILMEVNDEGTNDT